MLTLHLLNVGKQQQQQKKQKKKKQKKQQKTNKLLSLIRDSENKNIIFSYKCNHCLSLHVQLYTKFYSVNIKQML